MATIVTLNPGDEVDASVLNTNFSNLNNGLTTQQSSITTLSGTVTSLQSTVSTITGDLLPVGTVIWYAKNTAPTGYLVCNGSAVSRTDYSTLFDKIGTTFGSGDGTTTFNLPDLIGKIAYGATTMGENSLKTGNQDTNHGHAIQNAMGGSSTKHTDSQNANHKHSLSACGLLPCIKY